MLRQDPAEGCSILTSRRLFGSPLRFFPRRRRRLRVRINDQGLAEAGL
jgi:hypothetical protein